MVRRRRVSALGIEEQRVRTVLDFEQNNRADTLGHDNGRFGPLVLNLKSLFPEGKLVCGSAWLINRRESERPQRYCLS